MALDLPFTAHVSEHVCGGEPCTVVLRQTTTLPAKVTRRESGEYRANGVDDVLVLPGKHARRLRKALQAQPLGEEDVDSRTVERVKKILGTDDDSARAVAAFVKKHPPSRRRIYRCLRLSGKIAWDALSACLVAALFFFGAGAMALATNFVAAKDPLKDPEWYVPTLATAGAGAAYAVNGAVMACLYGLMKSFDVSGKCGAAYTLLAAAAVLSGLGWSGRLGRPSLLKAALLVLAMSLPLVSPNRGPA